MLDPCNLDSVSPDCLKQIDIPSVLWRARKYPFITEQDTEREVFSLQTLSDVSQFSLIQIKYPGPKHSLLGCWHQPITAQECPHCIAIAPITRHVLSLSAYYLMVVVTRRQLKPEQSCKTKSLVCGVLLAGLRDSWINGTFVQMHPKCHFMSRIVVSWLSNFRLSFISKRLI